MRTRLPGQFSVRCDGTMVTPTTSGRRKPLARQGIYARDAVVASGLAAESRTGRLPARLRRHAGMASSHEGCKLFAL